MSIGASQLNWANLANGYAESITYVIEGFSKKNAREYTFEVRNREKGTSEVMSVYDYFRKRYNITLLNPTLPLIQTTKKGVVLPMEVTMICENQKYPFKLDEFQVSVSESCVHLSD